MARKPSTVTRANIWMPIYWGDYLRDTGHLNAQEHGAYLMLIAHYWCTGRPLDDDNATLAKIARVTPGAWKKIRPTIAAFFEVAHERWGHKRIEKEIIAAFDRKEAAVARAKAGAAARWGTDASSILGASVKDASHNTNHTSEPLSENHTDPARDASLPLTGYATRAIPSVHERVAALAEKHRRKFA